MTLTSEKYSYYDLFSISVFKIKAKERKKYKELISIALSLLILVKSPKVLCCLSYTSQETDQIGVECDFFEQ